MFHLRSSVLCITHTHTHARTHTYTHTYTRTHTRLRIYTYYLDCYCILLQELFKIDFMKLNLQLMISGNAISIPVCTLDHHKFTIQPPNYLLSWPSSAEYLCMLTNRAMDCSETSLGHLDTTHNIFACYTEVLFERQNVLRWACWDQNFFSLRTSEFFFLIWGVL